MSRPRAARHLVLVLATLGTACLPEVDAPPSVELPTNLAAMELPVQQQFREAHARIADLSISAEPAPAVLAEAYGRLGMLFHAYGFHPSAAGCYSRAADLAPDEFRWPYYLALVERFNGRWAPAEAAARRALELRPDYTAARFALADILFDQGRLEEAEAALRRETSVDPAYAPAWIGRAKIALVRGDARQALELLREAEALRPGSSEVQYLLGQAHARLGDSAAAARHFAALPSDNLLYAGTGFGDPLIREVHELRIGSRERARAGAASATRNPELAMIELDQALAAEPTLVQVRLARAQLLYEAGDLPGAEQELRAVLADRPDYEPGLRLHGAIQEARGKPAAAEQLYRRALELNPAAAENLLALAELERRDGRLSDAERHYARAATLDPGLARAHFWRAVLLLAAGRTEEGTAIADKARRALPEDRPLALLAARLGGDSGGLGEDLSAGRQLFADRGDVAAAETLAMVFARHGNFAEAVAWQGVAVQALQADGQPARRAAARLEAYRGRRLSSAWDPDEEALSIAAPAPGSRASEGES